MKKGCLLSILLYAALAGGYYALLRDRYDPPAPWVGALVGAFVTWLALGMLSTARHARKDSATMDRAAAGGSPRDGEIWAATGTVLPLAEPLLSPFKRRPCVIYAYEVFHYSETRHKGSTRRSKSMERSGFAMTPSAVHGASGEMRILGFPVPDEFGAETMSTEDEREAARVYLETTELVPLEGFSPGRMFREISDVLTDDDGSVRKDWRISRGEPDLASATLQETIVPAGASVTVIGLYSAAKGGLVPDVGGSGTVNRIFPGSADEIARKRRSSARSHLIGGLLLLAVTQVALYFLLERRQEFQEPDRQARLVAAAADGDVAELGRLLKRGADAGAPERGGRTALLAAADPETVRFLLEHGARPDETGADGETPLMAAARQGELDKMRLLIAAGANLDARAGGRGLTALMTALDAEQEEAAALLRAAGAEDETVTAANGDPVPPAAEEGGPLAACLAYLAAVQAEDRETLRALSTRRDTDFSDVDFSAWKGSRPSSPVLVSGFGSPTAATLTVRGMTGGGFEATWVYQMVQRDGRWRVASERWLTKAGELAATADEPAATEVEPAATPGAAPERE